MKIYIVTKGTYSDYSIYGVFTKKELAEKYALLTTDRYDEGSIEEYEADPIFINPEIEKGELPFNVEIDKDNNIRVERNSVSDTFATYKWQPYGDNKTIVFAIWAKDEEEARQKATETKIKYLNELEYDWGKWRSLIDKVGNRI